MPRSGTRYSLLLEWALAARWWGIDWVRFCELSGEDQSFLIAVYRTAMQIEAVEAWHQARDAQRKSKS